MGGRLGTIIAIIAVIAIIIITIRFIAPEDTWTCKDGQWVKHGNPSAAKPTTTCQ